MKNDIKTKPVSDSELNKLRQYGNNDFMELILMTGLRRNEVLSAIKAFNINKDYVDIHTKKSGAKLNRIYLGKTAVIILKRLVKRKLNNVQTIYKSITRYTKAALGYSLAPHSFRSFYCTSLINSGIDLVTVSTLMNHKDVSTTARYVSVNEKGMRAAINSIDPLTEIGIEGMTLAETKKEIIRLRQRLSRYETQGGK